MTGMTPEDRKRVVEGIYVANAECFDASDLAMIHGNIIASHGSLEKFDESLKLLLLLEPLSYKEDLRQLARRSEDTQWDFRQVFDFLGGSGGGGGGNASSPRCLVIADSAGKGKSTISAALIRSVLGRRLEEDAAAAGASWEGPVSAHHLVKFSDQRRLDPVAMVKSIVFQVAQRVAAVRDLVFRLDVEEVDTLRDLDAAWKLLGGCLEKGCAGSEVIVLIDALDEGDPPEQQRADFDPATAGVVPLGNKALQLLVGYLSQLPPSFRFVVTTRPDAVLGNVLGVLERCFGGEGSCLAVDPSALVVEQQQQQQRRGGNLVYHAVLRENALDGVVAAPSSEEAPTLDDLYGLYAHMFEAKPPSEEGAVELLYVLTVAREPPPLALLQQMGLDVHLESLPGFGSLYYTSEHRVYMIRKWNQMFECRYLHVVVILALLIVAFVAWYISLDVQIFSLGNNYNDVL